MQTVNTTETGTELAPVPGIPGTLDDRAGRGEPQRPEAKDPPFRGDFTTTVIDLKKKAVTATTVFLAFDDHPVLCPTWEGQGELERLYAASQKLPNWKEVPQPANTDRLELAQYLHRCVDAVNSTLQNNAFIVFREHEKKPGYYAVVEYDRKDNRAWQPDCKILMQLRTKNPQLYSILGIILSKLHYVNRVQLWNSARFDAEEHFGNINHELEFELQKDLKPERKEGIEKELNDIAKERDHWNATADKILKNINPMHRVSMKLLKRKIRRYRKTPYLREWLQLAIQVIETSIKIHKYSEDRPNEEYDMGTFSPGEYHCFRWDSEAGHADESRQEKHINELFQERYENGDWADYRLARPLETTKDPFKWPASETFPALFEKLMRDANRLFYKLKTQYDDTTKKQNRRYAVSAKRSHSRTRKTVR